MKASEVRKDWKNVLDRAAAGETIQIERGGVVFYLSAKIFSQHTPLGPNGFYELQAKHQVLDVLETEKTPREEARLATSTTTEDKLEEMHDQVKRVQEDKGFEFCKSGHAINSRGKCFGKGCKYA